MRLQCGSWVSPSSAARYQRIIVWNRRICRKKPPASSFDRSRLEARLDNGALAMPVLVFTRSGLSVGAATMKDRISSLRALLCDRYPSKVIPIRTQVRNTAVILWSGFFFLALKEPTSFDLRNSFYDCVICRFRLSGACPAPRPCRSHRYPSTDGRSRAIAVRRLDRRRPARHRISTWFRPAARWSTMMSIRTKFFLAFSVLVALACSVAFSGFRGIAASGDLVVRLYDGPLMGINHACRRMRR